MFKQEKTKRKRDAVALLMLKSVARYSLCRLASLPAVTVSDCHCAQSQVHHNHTNSNKADTSQNKTASIYICLKSVLLFFNILQNSYDYCFGKGYKHVALTKKHDLNNKIMS